MGQTTSFDAVVKALRMLKRIRRLDGTLLIHEGVMLSADNRLSDEQNSAFVREVNAMVALYRNGDRPFRRMILGFDGGNVILFNVAPFTLALFFENIEEAVVVEKQGEEFLSTWADSLQITGAATIELPALTAETLSSASDTAVSEATKEADDALQPLLSVVESIDGEAPLPVEEETAETPEATEVEEVEEAESAELEIVSESPEPDESIASTEGALPDEELAEAEDELTEINPMEDSPAQTWNLFREKIENLFSKVLGRAQAKRFIERELRTMGVEEGGYLTLSQFRPFGQKLLKQVKDRSLRRQLESELVKMVEDLSA